MRPIDADEFMEQYNLKDATKYGNKDAEQQNHSYSTLYLYELADMIDDAPTIDISGKWIPCSERLPECEDYAETDALLFQLQSGTIEVGYFGRKNAWRDAYFRHYRTHCGVDASDVVAWMPLPEPYKE